MLTIGPRATREEIDRTTREEEAYLRLQWAAFLVAVAVVGTLVALIFHPI